MLKMNKNQTDALLLIIGRIASTLLAIVSVRVLTTMLLPEEIGRMAIFMTILGFFGLFMISPIGNYVNRQIIGWSKQGMLKAGLIYYAIYVLLVAVFALVIVLLMKLFFPLMQATSDLWFGSIIFVGLIVSSLFASFIGYLNLFQKRFAFVVLSNLAGWTAILSSVFLVAVFAKTAEYWLMGSFFAQFVFAGAALFILFQVSQKSGEAQGFNFNLTINNIKSVLRFALPLAATVLFYWVQTQGYRFELQSKYGLEMLGVFFVNFSLGSQLMTSFETLFNQFYHPIYYNNISSPDTSTRVLAWNAYGSAYLPALVITIIFIGCSFMMISKIMVASFYWSFSYLIFFGALTEALRIISTAYSLAAHAEYKTKVLILPSIVAAIAVILFIYILPAWNMYYGISAALITAGLIGLLILRIEIKKIVPVALPMIRLIKAIIFCSPMFLALWGSMLINGNQYYLMSILFVVAAYYLWGQYLFAKDWLMETL